MSIIKIKDSDFRILSNHNRNCEDDTFADKNLPPSSYQATSRIVLLSCTSQQLLRRIRNRTILNSPNLHMFRFASCLSVLLYTRHIDKRLRSIYNFMSATLGMIFLLRNGQHNRTCGKRDAMVVNLCLFRLLVVVIGWEYWSCSSKH